MEYHHHLLIVAGLLLILHSDLTSQNILGGGSPLYSENDKITLLNNTNFQSSICGSSRAWLVEFYSSWCGHCIHFAPTFKSLAADVYSWRSVIGVAAIDCAMEFNMPTCREYEVMGYPTLKFFSPNTPAGDMGQERVNRMDKTIDSIQSDMIKFIRDLQLSGNVSRIGQHWPSLVPLDATDSSLSSLWKEGEKAAVLMFEKDDSDIAGHAILDLSETVQQLNIPLAITKVEINTQSQSLMQKLNIGSQGGLIAIHKDLSVMDSFPSVAMTDRTQVVSAVKDFIWKNSAEFSVKSDNLVKQRGNSNPQVVNVKEPAKTKAASRKEIMSRRYKAYTSDLEKAVVYAISHEVAQHSAITGPTLAALHQFVTVLEKYFPARIEMSLLLRKLKSWVLQHQDTIRGEDLSAWFRSYQTQHSFEVSDHWIGCAGSSPQYGGYPCGLWSLWHVLTVSQANMNGGEPKEVLTAMKNYIQEFFGCRECARHFDQAIESGRLIEREVSNYKDAVLLLWLVHNKANKRLTGDISEDPVFPKETFPQREFCSSCYDNTVGGTNLWAEFNKDEVYQFLKNLYSREKLSSQGMSEHHVDSEEHGLVVVEQVEENIENVEDVGESLDMSNFKKEHNNASSLVFFNGADISICFFLWGISIVLLIIIYLKFVAGVKFSNSYLFHGLKRKTSSRNPLLGTV